MTYRTYFSSLAWSFEGLDAMALVGVVRVTLLPIERLTPARASCKSRSEQRGSLMAPSFSIWSFGGNMAHGQYLIDFG